MTELTLDTRLCMSHLLLKETFDRFSFIEGEIVTCNRFTMDGYLQKAFFEEPPAKEYSLWSDMREYCFSIIRGKRTPLIFKLIFSLAREDFSDFLKLYQLSFQEHELTGLYLNFRFDGTLLQCITGTSMNTFTLDKSLDHAWDDYVRKFFGQCQIPWEPSA